MGGAYGLVGHKGKSPIFCSTFVGTKLIGLLGEAGMEYYIVGLPFKQGHVLLVVCHLLLAADLLYAGMTKCNAHRAC